MRASLDSRDERYAYVGYIFQGLHALVMNLAPNLGIGDITERGPIDISDELSTRACEDYDFVRSILPNPVKRVYKFRMSLGAHNERPDVAVEFSNSTPFASRVKFRLR